MPGDLAKSLTKALKPLDFVLYLSLVEEWVGWLAKDCGHRVGPGAVGFRLLIAFLSRWGRGLVPPFLSLSLQCFLVVGRG